jgi:3-hydroxybutyryl-CoA dehydrogenase
VSEGLPDRIGVLGAGTMGAGIAQLAVLAGAETVVLDVAAETLERGLREVRERLSREVAKGRLEAAVAEAAAGRLRGVGTVAELRGCGLVVEAAPERLELKQALLGEVAQVVGPEAVLATNTSSLSVTELAAGVPGPERVVGLHFFNPAPVMGLVEVVAGELSSPRALEVARATGRAMGKRVIDAFDVAGFLVNRCNRPFSLEALRLVEEGLTTVAQVDRIAREAGGFRLGPFELMDLIGIDVNHAVAESFHRQSYGEPRYRPSPLAARKVAAGQLGRKSGRGWYGYGPRSSARPVAQGERPPRDQPLPGGRSVLIAGTLPVAEQLRSLAADAGWHVSTGAGATAQPWLVLDLRGHQELGAVPLGGEAPRAISLHDCSLHVGDPRAAGFHLLAPLAGARAAEVTRTPLTDAEAAARLEEFFASLGLAAVPVNDAPGLVLGRIVCQLINEAAFLLGAGLGSREDIDVGMELGVGHPRGPIAWSGLLHPLHVVAVLDALHRELGESRYRVAPALRQALLRGSPGL